VARTVSQKLSQRLKQAVWANNTIDTPVKLREIYTRRTASRPSR
jgi:hypothetical protein